MPSASHLTRALMSLVMKIVRSPRAFSPAATLRMRLSFLSSEPALAGHRLHARHADHASLLVPADALEEVPEAPQLVERADDLARVAARLVVVLLELVQLLDHRERDDDLVLLELEDRLRVVQQHVRVEHEMLLRCSRSLGG